MLYYMKLIIFLSLISLSYALECRVSNNITYVKRDTYFAPIGCPNGLKCINDECLANITSGKSHAHDDPRDRDYPHPTCYVRTDGGGQVTVFVCADPNCDDFTGNRACWDGYYCADLLGVNLEKWCNWEEEPNKHNELCEPGVHNSPVGREGTCQEGSASTLTISTSIIIIGLYMLFNS